MGEITERSSSPLNAPAAPSGLESCPISLGICLLEQNGATNRCVRGDDTGTRAGYAALRTQNDDMILVLVNLGEDTITDYSLSLAKSALPEGTYKLESLMGDGTAFPDLSVDAAGGFQPMSALPALAANGTWVLQLPPR